MFLYRNGGMGVISLKNKKSPKDTSSENSTGSPKNGAIGEPKTGENPAKNGLDQKNGHGHRNGHDGSKEKEKKNGHPIKNGKEVKTEHGITSKSGQDVTLDQAHANGHDPSNTEDTNGFNFTNGDFKFPDKGKLHTTVLNYLQYLCSF